MYDERASTERHEQRLFQVAGSPSWRRFRWCCLVWALAAVLLSAVDVTQSPAVDIYLKLDGINGESCCGDYKDQIDVLAVSWGMSQSGTFGTGGGGGAGKVNVQDISVTKYVDTATPELILRTANGKHIPKAEFHFVSAGERPVVLLAITLEKLLVSSWSAGSAVGDERMTETVTFNFASFEVEYQAQDDGGRPKGAPIKVGWDIETNTTK